MRVGHGAGHQARLAAALHAQGLAPVLKHPVQHLAHRGNLRPACVQRGADGGQLLIGGRGKACDDEDRRVGILHPLFIARVFAAPAMKDTRGVGGQRHGGNGVEQVLHRKVGVFLTSSAYPGTCPRAGHALDPSLLAVPSRLTVLARRQLGSHVGVFQQPVKEGSTTGTQSAGLCTGRN